VKIGFRHACRSIKRGRHETIEINPGGIVHGYHAPIMSGDKPRIYLQKLPAD